MSDIVEVWQQIAGYSGLYEVSNLGRVRSLPHQSVTGNRWGHCIRSFPGRVLSTPPNKSTGYPAVTLCDGRGGRAMKKVHILVAETFHGPRPPGCQALHRDGVKENCTEVNVRWGTPAENSADAAKHGTQARGERQGQSKLTEDAVREIRASDLTNEILAGKYGVSESAVAMAARGDSWAHVT